MMKKDLNSSVIVIVLSGEEDLPSTSSQHSKEHSIMKELSFLDFILTKFATQIRRLDKKINKLKNGNRNYVLDQVNESLLITYFCKYEILYFQTGPRDLPGT